MSTPIKRRIGPAYPIKIEYRDERGHPAVFVLRLIFDFNALTVILERTGLNLLEGEIWSGLGPAKLGMILWAASLACHPELNSDEGRERLLSYLDGQNSEAVAEAVVRGFAETLAEKRKAVYLDLLEKAKAQTGQQPDPSQPEAEIAPPATL